MKKDPTAVALVENAIRMANALRVFSGMYSIDRYEYEPGTFTFRLF